jgi:predicted PhzF superfamily epimerase YddE/YHI9
VTSTATLHILRVFTAEDGRYGNPLGVFLDGGLVPGECRQALARRLGFSETVFVDDARRGVVRIFTPGTELPFAGHPMVGTAWLLQQQGQDVAVLHPPAGEVGVRSDGELTWISGRAEWSAAVQPVQLSAAADVDALTAAPPGHDFAAAWAWLDEARGLVRSRVFPTDVGIVEDEATGLAAVRLCALLGRAIVIQQGRGSVLHARPLPDGRVEVGGRCVLDEVREEPIAP